MKCPVDEKVEDCIHSTEEGCKLPLCYELKTGIVSKKHNRRKTRKLKV